MCSVRAIHFVTRASSGAISGQGVKMIWPIFEATSMAGFLGSRPASGSQANSQVLARSPLLTSGAAGRKRCVFQRFLYHPYTVCLFPSNLLSKKILCSTVLIVYHGLDLVGTCLHNGPPDNSSARYIQIYMKGFSLELHIG